MNQTIVLLFACFISSQSVNASGSDTTKQDIKATEVRLNHPFMGETFYRVIHIGSYTLYQSQYYVDTTVMQAQFDSTVNEINIQEESGSEQWKNRPSWRKSFVR